MYNCNINYRIAEAKAEIADTKSTTKIKSLQDYIKILENITAFEHYNKLPKLLSGGKQVIISGGILRSPLSVNLPTKTTHIQIKSEDGKSIYYYVNTSKNLYQFVEQLEVQ